jgi:hypothetical protein
VLTAVGPQGKFAKRNEQKEIAMSTGCTGCIPTQPKTLEAVLEVVLTITLDETKSTPAIGFDSRVISFLHEVGASIDIDTYRGEI